MISFIDLFVVLTIVWGIWAGYQRGLIIEFFSFGMFIVGIILSNVFAMAATKVFPRYNMSSPYILLIMFLLALIATGYLSYLTGNIVKKMMGETEITPPMRYVGIAIGTGKMFLADSIILYLLNILHEAKNFLPDDMIERSLFNDALVTLAPLIFRFLNNYNFQDNII